MVINGAGCGIFGSGHHDKVLFMNISRSFFILCFLAIDSMAVAQPTGPSIDWATYYGGDSSSLAGGVITDAAGNVYMAGGYTTSRFGIA